MISNQLVLKVIKALESLDIPYMLVRSYSSNAYGVARSTQDADFVIELKDRSAGPLFDALLPELRFDPQMRLESVTMTSRFVGKHANSGFKIELFLVSEDAHDRERFTRRQRQTFLDAAAYLPTPEDVIIQKLRWFHLGRRAKDLEDTRNVTAAQFGHLDLMYIRNWCDQHGTRSLLEDVIDEARKFQPEKP